MPTHSDPRSSNALASRSPKVTASLRSAGKAAILHCSLRRRRSRDLPFLEALLVGQVRVADRVGQGAEAPFVQRLLQLGEHAHRRGWIAEDCGAHRYCRRAGEDELERI